MMAYGNWQNSTNALQPKTFLGKKSAVKSLEKNMPSLAVRSMANAAHFSAFIVSYLLGFFFSLELFCASIATDSSVSHGSCRTPLDEQLPSRTPPDAHYIAVQFLL
jgi:hypothetical protein